MSTGAARDMSTATDYSAHDRKLASPLAPASLADIDVEPSVLLDLTLKLAHTVPHLTTEWASRQVCLLPAVVDRLLWQLKDARFIEVLGEAAALDYRYAITERGRDRAQALLNVSGYVGPAPVSLESYTAMLQSQIAERSAPTLESVKRALAPLVLPHDAVEVAALAASSGRSLFLFGPPGNGKTTLARLLHDTIAGDLWIPHCICVESNIIRIFDRACHQPIEPGATHNGDASTDIDQRWVRIRRPFIVAGGELTINELDLTYSPSLRYYEAPPHVKANGGLFVIDDLGRQQVDPHDLLNRWIIPLEHQEDYLTLSTGQKIRIPFQLLLVVATNLAVADVADPAFLRRMGYRLHLAEPSEKAYAQIFERYAQQSGAAMPAAPGLVEFLLSRYRDEQRPLRASEPRDLIERSREICRIHGRPFELSWEILDRAWNAYFG